jgi:hypothetical protein
MRVTIIPEDGFVAINGDGYSKLDLSFIEPTINAVQWYGSEGEIEYKDSRGRATHNEEITSLDELGWFDQVEQLWQEAKAKAEATPGPDSVDPEYPTP